MISGENNLQIKKVQRSTILPKFNKRFEKIQNFNDNMVNIMSVKSEKDFK